MRNPGGGVAIRLCGLSAPPLSPKDPSPKPDIRAQKWSAERIRTIVCRLFACVSKLSELGGLHCSAFFYRGLENRPYPSQPYVLKFSSSSSRYLEDIQ